MAKETSKKQTKTIKTEIIESDNKIENKKEEKTTAKKQSKLKNIINFIKENKTVLLVGIIVILVLTIYTMSTPNKEQQLILSAENTLKSITKKEDINLVEYTYNAVATKKDDKKILYYVAYEGKVKAGIDFSEVTVKINNREKKVTITIPTPKINDATVVDNKFEYIFTKDKYEKENMKDEIYDLCEKDLKNRLNKEDLLLETAKENAIMTIQSFYQPWLDTLDEEYKLEISIKEAK